MQAPWSCRFVFDVQFISWTNNMLCCTLLQLSAVAPPPLCRNGMPNGLNLNTLNSDNSKSTVNPIIQAPRRKFVGEGKLRKVGSNVLPPFALLNKHINICGTLYVMDIDLITRLNLKITMAMFDTFFFWQ